VTPNKPGLVFEPGVARLLRGNSDIVMQIHYTATAKRTRTAPRWRHLCEAAADQDGRPGWRSIRGRDPRHDGNAEVRATTPLTATR